MRILDIPIASTSFYTQTSLIHQLDHILWFSCHFVFGSVNKVEFQKKKKDRTATLIGTTILFDLKTPCE